MTFCSTAGERDVLLRRFASLDVAFPEPAASGSRQSPEYNIKMATAPGTSAEITGPHDMVALSSVLAALRKLREGIVGSKRADEFAVQVYMFCIRLAILVKQPEAYHPAIQYLLRIIHPMQPLTPVELSEVVSYLVLDAACRRGALAEAYATRTMWNLKDIKVNAVVETVVHDDFVNFFRLLRKVDGHKARLMEWAEPGIRRHALKCLGKCYLTIDRQFLERVTSRNWDILIKEDGLGWELEGSRVIIRRVIKK